MADSSRFLSSMDKILQKIKKSLNLKSLDFIPYTPRPFGLSISDNSVEIVSLERKDDKFQISVIGQAEISPGASEQGKVPRQEELIKTIKSLISNPNLGKIRTKKIIASLPESKSFIHTFELPKDLKVSETPEFIKSRACQTFPFPPDRLCFDFQIENKNVLLVAALKNVIDNYQKIFKACDLHLIALENESLSLGRALIVKEEESILILNIGIEMTDLSIFDAKNLKLSLSTEVGGRKFTEAISNALKISLKEGKEIRDKNGLNPEEKGGRIFSILQKQVVPIIEEIKKAKSYFYQEKGKEIQKIVLTGQLARLPYLVDYLGDNLRIKVSIANPWKGINTDILKENRIRDIDPLHYSVATGLALRAFTKKLREETINLIE
jgi:type IV pilus assembly protein PilM